MMRELDERERRRDKLRAATIARLDALGGGIHPCGAQMHSEADHLLRVYLRAIGDREIVEAFERVIERAPFWAYE